MKCVLKENLLFIMFWKIHLQKQIMVLLELLNITKGTLPGPTGQGASVKVMPAHQQATMNVNRSKGKNKISVVITTRVTSIKSISRQGLDPGLLEIVVFIPIFDFYLFLNFCKAWDVRGFALVGVISDTLSLQFQS